MKERVELTRSQANPKLEEGDVFMTDKDNEMLPPPDNGGEQREDNPQAEVEWGKAYDLTKAPNYIRDFVRAAGKKGMDPSAIPEELRGLLSPFKINAGDVQKPNVEEEPPDEINEADSDISQAFDNDSPISDEAKDYIFELSQQVGSAKDLSKITLDAEKIADILVKNGISKEAVDRNRSNPQVLGSMLIARFISSKQREIDESAKPIDHGKDDPKPLTPPPDEDKILPSLEEAEEPDVDMTKVARTEEEQEKKWVKAVISREAAVRKDLNALEARLNDPELRKIMQENGISLEEGKEFVRKHFLDSQSMEEMVARHQQERRERGDIYVPQSLEELAQLVMHRATPEYRKGGDKCIVKYKRVKDANGNDVIGENGKPLETDLIESVNTTNFLSWARDNLALVHISNPTNPDLQYFGDLATNVKAEGFGTPISFYEITYTESYFLKEIKDENGNVIGFEKNKEYDALRTQMLMEAYILQINRNPAVRYITTDRSEMEKAVNAYAAANVLNPLTRSNFFEFIFSMPSMESVSALDSLSDKQKRIALKLTDIPDLDRLDLLAKIEGNYGMGTATREALLAYINIVNYDMLVKILGPDAPLFKLKYEKWDEWTARRDKDLGMKEVTPNVLSTDPQKDRKSVWYYTAEDVDKLWKEKKIRVKAGDVKLYKRRFGKATSVDPINGQPHPEFMSFLNVFLSPTPDQLSQNEVRERIRLSIMESNHISYREAYNAELLAFSMAHINGVAARNDTDSVAFDWLTRPFNILDKRRREKSASRHAQYGSEFNMQGLKRVGLNLFEAAWDKRRRSILKILQGGEGMDVHVKDNPYKNDVDFQRDNEGRIKFIDKSGNEVVLNVYSYNIEHQRILVKERGEIAQKYETKVVYRNNKGEVVDIGDAKPLGATVNKVTEPVEFETDVQKQYVANHIATAARIYEWIMQHKSFNFHDMIKGRDSRGNPIIDFDKVDEIKHGILHDIRYMVSTWGKINFAEKHMDWERVMLRDEATNRIIGTALGQEGVAGNEEEWVYLDEDWTVLDENGKKTDRIGEPVTYLDTKERTILESMFGAPAIKFIQAEIVKRGLALGKETIKVEDEKTGEIIEVDISAASDKENSKNMDNFRIAVYLGVFEYLVATDMEAHKTPGSGEQQYNFVDEINALDLIKMSELLEPYQANHIAKEKGLANKRRFLQQFGTDVIGGAPEGLLKALGVLFKTAFAE